MPRVTSRITSTYVKSLEAPLPLVAPKSGFNLPDPICAYDSAIVVEVVVEVVVE